MWMCATSPLPSSISIPWHSDFSLSATIISAKLPQRLFSLAVSAESRQPRKASVGTQAVLNAFMSSAKHQPSGPKTRKQSSSGHDSTGQERKLSGSDVLWALNRATAEKAKKKKKKKKDDVSISSTARKGENGEDKATDYTTVRPLTIKSEWSVRLEQLEERLRQLLGT